MSAFHDELVDTAAVLLTGVGVGAVMWAFASWNLAVWRGDRRALWSRVAARLPERRPAGRRRIGWRVEVLAWLADRRRVVAVPAPVSAAPAPAATPAGPAAAPSPVDPAVARPARPAPPSWPVNRSGLTVAQRAVIDAMFAKPVREQWPTAQWPIVGKVPAAATGQDLVDQMRVTEAVLRGETGSDDGEPTLYRSTADTAAPAEVSV
ncbi:hypothetical protein [Melissospora conviva]|uniref:hypothetical protein n=1 Tax=Melissospora conviva TaxID=3388432 RepID=UPI003C170AD3